MKTIRRIDFSTNPGECGPIDCVFGRYVRYADYARDVNERLEMVARAIAADERSEDGITPTAEAVRALKVAPE